MHDYAEALALACAVAEEAGARLRAELERPDGARGEGDHAPVDTEAEQHIRGRLLAAFPWAYLGEETGSDEGGDGHHRWLVDPNDGTIAFLRGFRGSAVSIAALRDGVPVLGVVYAFAFPDGRGDLIAWAEGCGPVRRNGEPVARELAIARELATETLDEHAVVVVSQGADTTAVANARCVAPARYLAMPSVAYRLALVAAGEAVAGVALLHPGDWDFAAGHALLRGAGGVLVDERGAAISYGADGASEPRRCFGGAPAAVAALVGRQWGAVLRPGRNARPPLTRLSPGQLERDPARLARAHGCLLGMLLGDAGDGASVDALAGQPTGAAELALTLARSLLAEGRFDSEAVRVAYDRWAQSSPFDQGAQTHANGVLLRAAPLAIFVADQPAKAAAWARAAAAITGAGGGTCAAAAALAHALAHAVGTGGDARTVYAAALSAARSDENAAIVATLEAAATESPGVTSPALHHAFFQLLHARTVEDALSDTLALGGDPAIVGMLLGAVRGRDSLPAARRRAVITCRPLAELGVRRPRPVAYWAVDALPLAETLLVRGAQRR